MLFTCSKVFYSVPFPAAKIKTAEGASMHKVDQEYIILVKSQEANLSQINWQSRMVKLLSVL